MKLKPSQEQGLTDLFNFLDNPTQQEIILQGEAGTGKTFLLAKFLTKLKDSKKHKKLSGIYLTAMTNKAVEAISEALIKHNVPDNFFCLNTTHSVLSLVVKFDYKTKKNILIKTRNNIGIYNSTNCLIIIDEASMINETVHVFIKQFLANKTNKVIYCCDEYQLKSVEEYDKSPIYDKTYNIPRITLKENVRQENSPLLYQTCTQLRNTVKNLQFNNITVNDKIHWVNKNDNILDSFLKEMFKEKQHNNRILSYSNEKTNYYNSLVRQINNLPSEPISGDFLICNSPVEKNDKIIIKNEEIIKLIRIKEDIIEIKTFKNTILELPVYFCDIQLSNRAILHNMPAIRNFAEYKKIKNIIFKNNLRNYYKIILNILDLRFTYASTVHKAQGSTYNNVLIDFDDFNRPFVISPDMLSRLLYVAFSRAQYNVFIVGKLHEQYGSILFK